MIMIHEDMPEEASLLASTLKQVFGFQSELINKNLEGMFTRLPEFDAYWDPRNQLEEYSRALGKKVLVITSRDIYGDNKSQTEDWFFGWHAGNLSLISSARLKRYDSKPSKELVVPQELYIKRLENIAVHEVGHDVLEIHQADGEVIYPEHFRQAVWVSIQERYKLNMDPHCTDNACVMCAGVDIRTPPPEEGYMLLGTERRYDALGLDDAIKRMNSNWFCDNCKPLIAKISDAHR